MMRRRPISIEVLEQNESRVLVRTYANGEIVRETIEKTKPTRKPRRPQVRLNLASRRKEEER